MSVPELIPPTTRVHASYVAALGESGEDVDGLADPEVFGRFVDRLLAEADEATPRPAGIVPQTTLWYVDGPAYLGRLSVRHRLNEYLREVGGHIGYEVRPSARRHGYATAMLHDSLPIALGLGITSALLTCDADNVGSRKVIEANGGRFEDQRGVKLRYWVPTHVPTEPDAAAGA